MRIPTASAAQRSPVLSSDYTPPSYRAISLELRFELDAQATRVHALTEVVRNGSQAADLRLNGEALQLVDLQVNGQHRQPEFDGDDLIVRDPGERALIRITTQLNPQDNSTLMGLYRSNGNYFTQCEAQGFRRITYSLDRPDVMARYRVLVLAREAETPVLLANGNLLAKGRCAETLPPGYQASMLAHLHPLQEWHWALWEDPFPKPTYLFALVAGQLVVNETTIQVGSPPRTALLQVWVEPGNEDKTDHAMQSLIRAIHWDEKRYGLALDLERFMIVAVGDFNMGAMENKGLNVFNTKYVFAHPRMATDTDFANVEAVVGHEYFHNWTGNRVTCRDWFQLTLKEGLTVFRDQEFSADILAEQATSPAAAASARAVKRIEDVRVLRSAQFAEDAGPMAHPIRPDSYQEINNFYTVTVYEKGAEVIRMMQTLVGVSGFRKAMDLYFARHDGQAVTCDDFIAAVADANQIDLEQFKRWYSQAGTPHVRVQERWDAESGMLHLDLRQSCAPTPGQPEKLPFLIPLSIGLLDAQGHELALNAQGDTTEVVQLCEAEQTFSWGPFSQRPVLSAGRGFSAPVVLQQDQSDSTLAFLAAHDTDPFNRWEAGQRLAANAILACVAGIDVRVAAQVLTEVMASILAADLDPAFKEQCLMLPAEGFIAEQLAVVDPWAVRSARNAVRDHLAITLQTQWHSTYEALRADHLSDATRTPDPYSADPGPAGRRALANLALGYWAASLAQEAMQCVKDQLRRGTNLTDRAAALNCLIQGLDPERDGLIEAFAQEFADEALVLDKWFLLQATAQTRSAQHSRTTLDRVQALMHHPQFTLRNPNRARALIASFCHGNLGEFHLPDGRGYEFWADQVIALNGINPQVAARLARAMDRWRKFTPELGEKMAVAMRRVRACENLSSDVQEIIDKALAA